MHKRGIVHRDVKPANMLVGDDCQIMFCDFGLARAQPTVPLHARKDHRRAQSFLVTTATMGIPTKTDFMAGG